MNRDDERAALLAAVIADPADDLPRLAYADWLDEYGDRADLDRAEFVRVQVELGRHDRWKTSSGVRYTIAPLAFRSAEYKRLFQRGRVLLLENWREWTPRLSPADSFEVILSPRWEYGGTPAVLFRRGFVAEVRAPLAALLEYGPAVCAAHPVEKMVATDRQPQDFGEVFGFWAYAEPHDGTERPDEPDDLPLELWSLLEGDVQREPSSGFRFYPSRAAALEALSAALLTYCRQAAGLTDAPAPE